MQKLLTKSLISSFCLNNRVSRFYDIAFQIKDVTFIRGLLTDKPYFVIEDKKIELSKNDLLFSLNPIEEAQSNYFQFFDYNLNLYHPTTPFSVVCKQPFFVKRKGNLYCVLNNSPIVQLNQGQQLNKTQCPKVIETLCKDSLQDLPDNQKQTLSGPAIHNIMITNLLRDSMNFKLQKIKLKELVKVVNKEIDLFEKQIKEVEIEIQKKANRRIKNYTSFLFFQYVVMHYYIYSYLSWDIMQPVTVIFANFDIFIGYLFFVIRGREWTLGEMYGNFVNQRRYSILKKNGINVEKYDELLKIKQYMKLRLSFLSKNPYQLIQTLEKPITMLDTR